jgi:starvation-inducible outer membrane lipoprotein
VKNCKVILFLAFSFSVMLCGCASKPQCYSKQTKTAAVEPIRKSSNKAKIICPKCRKPGVRIVYGKPGRKTMEKANKKEIYLGGCVRIKNAPSPKYHCYNCDNNWGKRPS